MRRIVIAAAVSLCVVSLAGISSADTLMMRDGTRIQGQWRVDVDCRARMSNVNR